MANGISGILAPRFPVWMDSVPHISFPTSPPDPGRPTSWTVSDLLGGRERWWGAGLHQASESESPSNSSRLKSGHRGPQKAFLPNAGRTMGKRVLALWLFFGFTFRWCLFFLNKDIPCFYTKISLPWKSPNEPLKCINIISFQLAPRSRLSSETDRIKCLENVRTWRFFSLVVCLVCLLPPLLFNLFLRDNTVNMFQKSENTKWCSAKKNLIPLLFPVCPAPLRHTQEHFS